MNHIIKYKTFNIPVDLKEGDTVVFGDNKQAYMFTGFVTSDNGAAMRSWRSACRACGAPLVVKTPLTNTDNITRNCAKHKGQRVARGVKPVPHKPIPTPAKPTLTKEHHALLKAWMVQHSPNEANIQGWSLERYTVERESYISRLVSGYAIDTMI